MNENMNTIEPVEYPRGLVNALKGARPSNPDPQNDLNTLRFDHLPWSELEKDETDTAEMIRERAQARWNGFWPNYHKNGLRISIHMNTQPWFGQIEDGIPNGLTVDDYKNHTPEYQRRIRLFIAKLGQALDNDPRVAWLNLGFYGEGGSHEHPEISEAQQEILSSAYNRAFKNKKLIMNFTRYFLEEEYGVYNRSWTHNLELQQLDDIEDLNRRTGRYKIAPITGHVSYYDEKSLPIHPGLNADDTLSNPKHFKFLLDSVRKTHATALGSVCNYTPGNQEALEACLELQKTLGYRYVISKAGWSREVNAGGNLEFSFTVKNTGSAPFYYDWPVYLSFLNPETLEVVAKSELTDIDIRKWLPGDDWDEQDEVYRVSALDYVESSSLKVPANLENGKKYVVALSINDPLSGMPAVRFAIMNYLGGGFHPFGYITVGQSVTGGFEIDPKTFVDPWDERYLPYRLPG